MEPNVYNEILLDENTPKEVAAFNFLLTDIDALSPIIKIDYYKENNELKILLSPLKSMKFMIRTRIAWASIVSIPYAMLSDSLPSNKMGYYMGVFNFFIVIPQLVAASILGFLVSKFFNSEPIYVLLIGGASMILAGIIALTINDKSKNYN